MEITTAAAQAWGGVLAEHGHAKDALAELHALQAREFIALGRGFRRNLRLAQLSPCDTELAPLFLERIDFF